MKTKMNIGSSSLILIFIVLCLVTFGLLSVSSAKNDMELARRNADAVKEYYRADSEGESFIAMADGKLKELGNPRKKGAYESGNVSQSELKELFGAYYDEENDIIRTDIPMERGQALHVELEVTKENAEKQPECRINAFYVYNQEDYEIDQSMPVWTGQ